MFGNARRQLDHGRTLDALTAEAAEWRDLHAASATDGEDSDAAKARRRYDEFIAQLPVIADRSNGEQSVVDAYAAHDEALAACYATCNDLRDAIRGSGLCDKYIAEAIRDCSRAAVYDLRHAANKGEAGEVKGGTRRYARVVKTATTTEEVAKVTDVPETVPTGPPLVVM